MNRSTLIAAFALTLAACDDPSETPEADGASVNWQLDGLKPLGDGYVYEGWVIVDGAPVSTGRFGIGEDGAPELTHAELTDAQASAASAFVLTIEPVDGDDPAPSSSKLLGGDLVDGSAELAIDHGAALGTDLMDATAPFILETPTTSDIADDYANGVWWLDPAAGPGASADLPALPAGWVYEGWVVTDDVPISTGRFATADEADSDGAGPEAGPDGAPPFPGQDFISPALDLVGTTVVISVEPEPDDSAAPFLLKPLVLASVPDAGPGVLIDMDNQAQTTNPGGMAWIE